MEEGEQNSAYFFRLEREQAKNNQIKTFMVDGNITDDSSSVPNFTAIYILQNDPQKIQIIFFRRYLT